MPTPAVVAGARTHIKAVLLSFRTASHAAVYEVDVYDGDKRIAEYMNIELRGDCLDTHFEVSGNPQAKRGINISAGVRFDSSAPDEQSMRIEMVGAGVEFWG